MLRGFFTYPWDLIDGQPFDILSKMRDVYGCNAISLNASYHHLRTLRPRGTSFKIIERPEGLVSFWPQKALYPPTMMPVADPTLIENQVLDKAQKACRILDMDLGLWMVGLHNSTLGHRNLDSCMVNCFGDVYPYALCPSAATAQHFLRGLVEDVCQQIAPQRLMMEAISFLNLRHGEHHELFLFPWTDLIDLFTGVCFCPSCVHNALQAGIDVESLRVRVSAQAHQLLNAEQGDYPASFSANEKDAFLAAWPELKAYLMVATATITRLTRSLHQIAHRYNVQLEMIPTSAHQTLARAWMEGCDLAELSTACDRFLVLSYFSNPDTVKNDLETLKLFAPQAKFSSGLLACTPVTPDLPTLVQNALTCAAAGSQGIYYYNYGLLPEHRLSWISEVNHQLILAGFGDE